jgi:predicted phage terminase large subunit-like protein
MTQDQTQVTIGPQPGPQTLFFESPADIVIYGGAAGGGKTWSLLYESLRHIHNPGFRFALFRRTQAQLTKPGGLWDESQEVYGLANGTPREMGHKWKFPSGAQGEFSGMQYESDKLDYQGSQICYIGFDQLEQFTESQFFFMLSRNRSTCGVPSYIRANANPEPGWLADFLSWWIADDGYADMARVGVLRWMVRDDNTVLWFDSEEEAIAQYGRDEEGRPINPPKSITFIPASVYDNQKLLDEDPTYIANLMALPATERKRLLGDRVRGGNWRIKPGGTKFKRHWFKIVDDYPEDALMVRFWDLAATKPAKGKRPDWTAGCLMAMKEGQFWVVDIERQRLNPKGLERLLSNTWQRDGNDVPVRIEEEGGSSGKIAMDHYSRYVFVGADFAGVRPTKNKILRAHPVSAAAESGNVYMVRGDWNKDCLDELDSFSPTCDHDDQVDAISGAHQFLSLQYINPHIYADDEAETYSKIAVDKEIEELLAGMSPEERAEALQLMAVKE